MVQVPVHPVMSIHCTSALAAVSVQKLVCVLCTAQEGLLMRCLAFFVSVESTCVEQSKFQAAMREFYRWMRFEK